MLDAEDHDDRPARQADITNHERRITRLETGERHQNDTIAAIQMTIRTEFSDIKAALAGLQSWQARAFKIAGAVGAGIVAAAYALLQHYFGG